MEIGNPELVNLLVENRIAEIEAEIAGLKSDRAKLQETADQIANAEEEAMVKRIVELNSPNLAKIVELYEEMTGSELPPLEVSPTLEVSPGRRYLSVMEGKCHVSIGWDSNKYVLSDDEENFVGSLQWIEEFPVNEATAAGYESLMEDIRSLGKKIDSLREQISNRESIGRKMLAKLTAKTLQDNPELHKHVLETASNIGGGLFIESKV